LFDFYIYIEGLFSRTPSELMSERCPKCPCIFGHPIPFPTGILSVCHHCGSAVIFIP
jgi:hypothetical protein